MKNIVVDFCTWLKSQSGINAYANYIEPNFTHAETTYKKKILVSLSEINKDHSKFYIASMRIKVTANDFHESKDIAFDFFKIGTYFNTTMGSIKAKSIYFNSISYDGTEGNNEWVHSVRVEIKI